LNRELDKITLKIRQPYSEGMMFVASSNAPDPVAAFTQLAENPENWPPVMRCDAANPNVPRYYVLLHDARGVAAAEAAEAAAAGAAGEAGRAAAAAITREELDAKLQHLRATFGATSVNVLTVNSGPGATPPPDIWSEHAEVRVVTADDAAAGGKRKGALFSDEVGLYKLNPADP
jgi:hypothetical protein